MICFSLVPGFKLLFLQLFTQLLNLVAQLSQLLLDPLILIHKLLVNLLRPVRIPELLASRERAVWPLRELPRRKLTGERSAKLTGTELTLAKLPLAGLTLTFRILFTAVAQGDGDLLFLIVAKHREFGFCFRLHFVDVRDEFGCVVNFFAVDLDDDVAGPQAGSGRWPLGSDLGNLRPPLRAGAFCALGAFCPPCPCCAFWPPGTLGAFCSGSCRRTPSHPWSPCVGRGMISIVD